MKNEKNNVFKTYNIIANWFFENRDQQLTEKAYLDKLIEIAGKGASVLDLGCGTGMPIMNYLVNQGMHVTGADGSHRMLEIARTNLPLQNFVQADMRQLALDKKFDAIIAWHSFFHLPPEDQRGMFDIFKKHLNPNGVLLFTSDKTSGEAWGMNGGENLYHASLDKDEYRLQLESNGFRVLAYNEDDPECGQATVWMAQLGEFWESAFNEKQAMWGFEPSKSAILARDFFVQRSIENILIPGIGYGRNAQIFRESGIRVTGIEISKTAIEMAEKHYGKDMVIYHGSVTDMPFDQDQYDGIFCYALIHLLDSAERKKLILDCYNQLSKNGYMVFTAISKTAHTYGQGKLISKDRYEIIDGVQLFFYDEDSIRSEFTAAGLFEITEISENQPFFLIKCKKV